MGTFAITGSASGIGAQIRSQLEQAGHTIIGVDLRDSEINIDLSMPEGRRQAVDALIRQSPAGLDGLVTCAGVASQVKDLALIPSLNYFGTIEFVEGLYAHIAKRRGAIVIISSNSAPHDTSDTYLQAMFDGDEQLARSLAIKIGGHQAYSGSKQAVARWMRSQAPRYARDGIRLNAVAPGYTETPMTQAVMSDATYGDAIKQFLASIPLGRGGRPTEIANVVNFLLSEQASFVCGSLIYVDGAHDAMFRPDAI